MAMGLVKHNFNLGGDNNASVVGGYRGISWDYKKGSGDNKFEWDVTFSGPMLGFSYQF